MALYDLPILPSLPGLGSGESSYGSAPYAETAARAQARLGLRDRLLAGLAGLGSVQPGMNFGQSFTAALGGSARATWAAKQAALNYAQRQVDQEIARQNAETQRLNALGKGAENPTPPEWRPENFDAPWAIAKRKADETKAAGGLTTIVGPNGKPLLVRESDAVGKIPYVKPEKAKDTGPDIGRYDKLSDNFKTEQSVKDYGTVRDSYRRIVASSKLDSGYGDLSMIFSYMKVLDPTSTVREGEFANAQQAMGQLQKMTNVPRQWWSGTRLTPAGRAGLVKAAKALRDAQKETYDATVNRYRATAKKYGVDPTDFISPDIPDLPDSAPPSGLDRFVR